MSAPLEVWRILLGRGGSPSAVVVAVVMAGDGPEALDLAQVRPEASACTVFDWRLVGHALPHYTHAAIISMHAAEGL